MRWQNDLASRFRLSEAQVDSLSTLLKRVQTNSDRGLTAVKSEKGLLNVHFYDSLGLLGYLPQTDALRLIDIGSGAGFPGLPLAIARPDIEVTLLEASARKCAFIREAIAEIGLENADVLNGRAEDLAHTDARESFDVALARAVGPLATVLELALPLVRLNGKALLQRGRREEGDSELARVVASQLGGLLETIESVQPYAGAQNLHVWIFRKKEKTESRYPRRAGMPAKRPLNGTSRH